MYTPQLNQWLATFRLSDGEVGQLYRDFAQIERSLSLLVGKIVACLDTHFSLRLGYFKFLAKKLPYTGQLQFVHQGGRVWPCATPVTAAAMRSSGIFGLRSAVSSPFASWNVSANCV